MLRTTSICISLALAVIACNKDKKDEGGAAASSGKSAEPAAGGGGGGGPVKTTPKDLFADFGPNSPLKGMDLIDKYRDGATFTGTVTQTMTEGDGSPIIWVDVDGKAHIDVKFADPAKGKGVKKGDSLTVTCKVGGESGNMMMVTDCT